MRNYQKILDEPQSPCYLDSEAYAEYCITVLDAVRALHDQSIPATVANLKRADARIKDRDKDLLNAIESLIGAGELERYQLGAFSAWRSPTRTAARYVPTKEFHLGLPADKTMPDVSHLIR